MQLKKETEASQCRFIVAMLEFFHHAVVQMPGRVLDLSWSGPNTGVHPSHGQDHAEDCAWDESDRVHRSASVARWRFCRIADIAIHMPHAVSESAAKAVEKQVFADGVRAPTWR